jgi:glycosyltransferase involved in cell wall biosynthesis
MGVAQPEVKDVSRVQPLVEEPEISVVMPCLNEAATIGGCVREAFQAMEQLGIRGEVIVGDNGSTDGSDEIAESLGARVVHVKRRGYGSALRGAIAQARGRFVLMGDADGSYDFSQVGVFLGKLREGYDLVMGNRFKGGIRPGAMPVLHRYLGNPVLSAIGRLFFKSPVKDFQCGLRAFRKAAIEGVELQTRGMEFASEMVVKATLFGLRITEVPTTLVPDGRNRPPHLRTWRDGWRYLRFLLLYSPRWLFLYPGLALLLLGVAISAWLLAGPRRIGSVTFDVHTLLFASMAILIGFQSVNFALFTKMFAVTQGLLPNDRRLERVFRHIRLERGLIAGALLALVGVALWVVALSTWALLHFGPLDSPAVLRIVIFGFISMTLGFQIILSSFFFSVLRMARR